MPLFIDEYPAAIEHAKKMVERAYLDARRSQAALPEYNRAKEHLAKLKYEYAMGGMSTPAAERT